MVSGIATPYIDRNGQFCFLGMCSCRDVMRDEGHSRCGRLSPAFSSGRLPRAPTNARWRRTEQAESTHPASPPAGVLSLLSLLLLLLQAVSFREPHRRPIHGFAEITVRVAKQGLSPVASIAIRRKAASCKLIDIIATTIITRPTCGIHVNPKLDPSTIPKLPRERDPASKKPPPRSQTHSRQP